MDFYGTEIYSTIKLIYRKSVSHRNDNSTFHAKIMKRKGKFSY